MLFDNIQIDIKKLQKQLQKSLKNGKTIEQAINEDDSKKADRVIDAVLSQAESKNVRFDQT